MPEKSIILMWKMQKCSGLFHDQERNLLREQGCTERATIGRHRIRSTEGENNNSWEFVSSLCAFVCVQLTHTWTTYRLLFSYFYSSVRALVSAASNIE